MEAAQRKYQDAVRSLVDDLDRTLLRKKQADMHRCAASCCDDTTSSMEYVQSCVQRCSQDVSAASNYVQNELSNFQSRLERCAVDCQDKIRDKVTADTKPEDYDKFRPVYEDCFFKCVDNHCHQIPTLSKRIKANISSKKYPPV